MHWHNNNANTCMHARMHIHTHTHKHTAACSPLSPACQKEHTHTHMCTHICTDIHTHPHVSMHTHTSACPHVCTHLADIAPSQVNLVCLSHMVSGSSVSWSKRLLSAVCHHVSPLWHTSCCGCCGQFGWSALWLGCLCFCWCLSGAGGIWSSVYSLFLLCIVIVGKCGSREGTQC